MWFQSWSGGISSACKHCSKTDSALSLPSMQTRRLMLVFHLLSENSLGLATGVSLQAAFRLGDLLLYMESFASCTGM